MSNVIPIIPSLDPDIVLEKAKGEYDIVIIAGIEKDGAFTLRHGGEGNLAEAAYLLQLGVHKIMNGDYND